MRIQEILAIISAEMPKASDMAASQKSDRAKQIADPVADKIASVIRILFSAVLMLGILTQPAWAATYYYSQSDGNNADDGLSEANAKQTIANFNAASFSPGDTIKFKCGDTWAEAMTVPSSGSSGSPVTVSRYGACTNANDPIANGLTISNKNFVIVEFLQVVNAATTGVTISQTGSGTPSDITLRYLTITGSGGDGIFQWKSGSNLIERLSIYQCHVYDNGFSGIRLTGSSIDSHVHHNRVHDNETDPADSFGGGIKLSGSLTTGALVEYNEVFNESLAVDDGTVRGVGIWLDTVGASSTNIVRYNNTHDNYAAGIMLEDSGAAQIYYNLVWNNDNRPTFSRGIYLSRPINGARVLNNTVYGSARGIDLTGTSSDIQNVLVANNVVLGSTVRFYSQQLSTGNLLLNNAFGAEADNFLRWNGTDHDTYAAFDAGYGADSDSVAGDPVFVNAATADFHLDAGSPAINAGINVSLAKDFEGNPVASTNIDIGALEGSNSATFVAVTGSDAGSGLSSSPYRTINFAADSAAPGDTILVRDGLYPETPTITVSGSAGNVITIRAENFLGAVIDGLRTTENGIIRIFDEVDYLTIDGFDIRNGQTGGISIGDTDGPNEHITLTRLAIHNIGNICTTTSGGLVGIRSKLATSFLTMNAILFYDIGRYAHGEKGCDTGGNNNWQNHDHHIYTFGTNITITNCVFETPDRGWGVQTPAGSNTWLIAFNTCHGANPDREGCFTLDTYEGNASNISYLANVFDNPTGAMITVANPGALPCGAVPGLVARNNLSTEAKIITDEFGTEMAGCGGFTVSGNVTGAADVGFVDGASGNFHLDAASPAIGLGLPGYLNEDYDGVARPQGSGPDAGAFEFEQPLTVNPRIGLLAQAGTPIICIGCTINLFPYEIPPAPEPDELFELISCETTNPQYWQAAGFNDATATYSTSPFQLTPAQAIVGGDPIGEDPVNAWCDPFGEGDYPYIRKETAQ